MTREAVGAVVEAAGAPIRVETILVDDPGPGEVIVRVAANGICHSDHWAIHHGNWGEPFPMLLGHEGAGVVEAIGAGVARVEPGVPVILAWAVPCGRCRVCLRGEPRRCAHEWTQPPRMRRASTGQPLLGTLGIGSLASHVVVHAEQAIPVDEAADLSRVCLLGCGVSTGIGAAVNTARVRPGSSVAVIGLGGIGLAALQGARIAGADPLIAVDLVAEKLATAAALGATHHVHAATTDAVTAVRDLTGGEGVDVAFEATGVAGVVAQAVAMLARSGTAVAIGVPDPGSAITLPWGDGEPGSAYPNKATLLVTDGGDPIPDEDFPSWVRWYLDGRLDLDSMVTREVGLTEHDLDEAFRAMLAGEVVRTVVHTET